MAFFVKWQILATNRDAYFAVSTGTPTNNLNCLIILSDNCIHNIRLWNYIFSFSLAMSFEKH